MGAFVGYLVGALFAEVSIARRVDPARRSASVVPRELGQYMPRVLLHAQRALGIAVLLGAIARGVVPFKQSAGDVEPQWLALLLVACSGVFFGLATSDVAVLRATMWLPAVATLLLAIRACLDIGPRAWRVRRPVAPPTGARPA